MWKISAIFLSAFFMRRSFAQAAAFFTIAVTRSSIGRYSNAPSGSTRRSAIGTPWIAPSSSGSAAPMEVSMAFSPSGFFFQSSPVVRSV